MHINSEDQYSKSSSVLTRKESLIQRLYEINTSEPLRDSSKHFRKGLILSSFIAIIIGSFPIQFESFLGFRIISGSIDSSVLEGLFFLVVLYYTITYSVYVIGDFLAWKFQRERIAATEYIRALHDLTNEIKTTFQSLEATNSNIINIYSRRDYRSHEEALATTKSISQEIIRLSNSFKMLNDGFVADFMRDQQILRTIRKQNVQAYLKLAGTVCIDILFPLGMAMLALSKTFCGVEPVFSVIF